MSRILPQCPEPFGHHWTWLLHLKSTYHDNLTPQARIHPFSNSLLYS